MARTETYVFMRFLTGFVVPVFSRARPSNQLPVGACMNSVRDMMILLAFCLSRWKTHYMGAPTSSVLAYIGIVRAL